MPLPPRTIYTPQRRRKLKPTQPFVLVGVALRIRFTTRVLFLSLPTNTSLYNPSQQTQSPNASAAQPTVPHRPVIHFPVRTPLHTGLGLAGGFLPAAPITPVVLPPLRRRISRANIQPPPTPSNPQTTLEIPQTISIPDTFTRHPALPNYVRQKVKRENRPRES